MKIPRLPLLAAFVIAFACLFTTKTFAQTFTAKYTSIVGNTGGYWEYLPVNYNAAGNTKKYPLILFSQGLGELGDGSPAMLPDILKVGLPRVLSSGGFPATFTVNNETFSFIVISPQFRQAPSVNDWQTIMNYAIQNYRVDPNRIYMTGLSNGGGCSWEYASFSPAYANRLAGIVPICGSTWPNAQRARIIADANLAVWATHNDLDPIWSVQSTIGWVNLINTVPLPNPLAKITVFQNNSSHDAWSVTYDPNYRENGKNIYEWMLQFHRNNIGNQPPITYAGGSISISSPTTSALLNGSASWDPDGTITTYSWTKKSGPSQYSINNAAIPSPFLTNLVEGRYVFELTATDNGGAASTDSVVVDVYPAVKNIPGKIQGENYTTMSGVTLETCLDIAGGIDVGGLDMGDWMEYDVNIASAGPYVVKFRVAAFPTGAEIQLKSNGTLIKSFAVPQTGEWQLWTTITDTIQLQSGPQKLRVYSGNTNSWNLNWMEFIAIDQSPTANAGPPQTIITPASATTLNGSGTAYNGRTITSYLWTQTSGDAATITNPTLPVTTVTGLTTIGIRTFKLTVTDNENKIGTSEVNVAVNPPGPPTAYAGPQQTIQLPTSQVSLSGSGTIGNGGTITYAWSYTSKPASSPVPVFTSATTASTLATGLVEGTYIFRLTVTQNDNSTATSDVTIVVNAVNPSTPYGGTRRSIPGKLEAEDFDAGGQNIAYYDGTAGNSGNATRTTESVDLRNSTDAGGGFCTGWTTDGEWLKFSVTVTTTGIYDFSARIASTSTGKSIQFQVDGGTAGILSVGNTGNFNTWQTFTLNNIPLTQGNHTFRFLFNTGSTTNADFGFDVNWFNFVLTASNTPIASAGAAQTLQLPASQVTLTGNGAPGNGGTITFAWTKITSPVSAPNPIIAIPNAASTLVTGLTEGVYVFRLTVTQNDNQVATSDVTITVVPVPTLPIITTNDPQTIVTTNVALSSTSSGNVPLVSTKWTKFSVQGQGLKKLTVIGSSTAAGNGTTSGDSTLVNRLKAYYQAQGILSTVTNLAQSGSTPFDLNITTTLNTTQPDVLLVCYPSNLYTASTNITVLARFQEIYDSATNRGIACYISGTQPRNDFNAADRANLIVLNEALRTKFEAKFIDFLTATLNTTDNSIKTEFSAGDGIHLNNTGHERLYQLVRAANIFQTKFTSTAVIGSPTSLNTNITGLTTGVHQFQVSIIDSRGFAGSAIAKVTVNIPNPPPTANAGTQQTISVPVSTVTLTGNGTANNGGSITGYEWTQVNGTAAVITNPNSATTTVTGLTTAGVRIFRLTVTDNVGGTASATVSITVNTVSDGKTIPGRIEAESWNTKSGPFYAVATNDPTGGVQQVIGITNGSWMDYNVNVAFTGMYTVNFRVATSQAHAQFQVKKDNTVLATVNIPSTGDWINWATVTVNNVALTSGTQTLRILSTNNESCNFNWMEFISTNVPPTATAGLPQTITLPVSEVTLTGTGTGNNGATIASYAWTRVSGPNNTPALNIVSPTTASTSVTGLVQGTYVFRLTVTDNLGGTGIADVTITVNQPPTADAGTTQTILVPLSQVLLTGSGTSGNGGSLTYAWTRVSGPNDAPNLNIVSASAASTLVTGLIQGSYVFRLTITNTNSATATSDVSVIVAPGPPTVSAGSTKTIILPASSVTVTGTATPNNGGSITGYTWTKTSGPAGAPDVTIETPTTASTLINGLVQGDYIFQLLATQDDAQTASSQVTVHVIPPIPPTANAGTPQTIALPASQVTLTGTGTPGNGGTITYAWTRVSGPNDAPDLTIVSPTTASTSVTGLIEGVYIFKLTVTNNDGGTATSQVTITVIQAPTANAGAAQTIQLPVSQVSLSGSGTSGNGGPITYAWTRVSGPNTTPALSIISPSSANTQVTGLIQGVYVFRLTVSNNVAMSVTSDVTVTVYPAPTANAGATQIVTLPTNQVTLSGNGTAGNGGTITYAWTRVSGPNNTPVLNIVSPTSATTLVTGMVQGVYVFRLTVTNNDLVSATSDVTINVNPLDPTTPYGGTRRPIPGKLEAEEYDGGGQGISYNDANAANLGGALRTTEGVDLRTCPDVGGGYAIGWTTDGEWVKFSVNVITSGIYDFAARIASPNTGKSLQFQVDGVTTGTLNIANTGGFNNWQTVTLSNISLTEGYHIFRFLLNTGSAVNTDFGFDINWFNFILTATTAPTANAGSTQTIIVPASQVTLSGTGTAATNKTITGYAWTRVSGPNNTPVLSIVSSNTASTQVTGMVQGTYVFRLTVTQNDNQTATSDVTVNVVPPGPPTANAGIAQAIQLPTNQISLSGSGTPGNGGTLTYGWTRVSGPNNTPILSIVSPTNATTLVTGMVQGTYVFRLTVTQNDDQTATSDVTITVNPENLSTPYGGTRKTIPGKLEAEEYDLGGQNLAYNDGTTINSGSAFRLTEGVDVRTCPDVGGGYAIGWTTDGEWMKYSVNVTTSGIYDFSIRAASPNTGKSIQFQVDGATAGTLTVANSGGFNNWQTSTLTGIPLTSGNHTFRFLINSGNTTNPDFGFDINWFNFVLSASTAPVANAGPVQTIVLPTSQVTLTGSGIPGNGGTVTYVWTRVSGPNNTPALSIVSPTLASTSVTGLVFGTYVFRLTVTQNDNQTSTSDVTINVVQPGPPTASAGSTQTITLPTSQVTLTGTGTAGNGGTITYAWTRVSGPNNTPALNIVSPSVASTQVTGMVQGTYVFRLTVTQNDLQTATSDVTINVNPLSNGKTIPGKIEAESWDAKSGPFYAVATADVGGGQQVIGISNGSWMDYNVNVTQTGTYSVGFRVATTQAHAQFQLKLGNTVLGTANVPNTGDWGNWATLTVTNVALTAGAQTLRIISTNTESCNFNWVNFAITSAPATTSPRTIVQTASSATEELIEDSYAAIFPNPVKDKFTLKMNNNYTGPVKVQLFDQAGRLVKQIQHTKNKGVSQLVISTNDLFTGLYIIKLQSGDRIELIKMIRLE